MTAFSADSIESSTVVGYQTFNTVVGFNFISSTFIPTLGAEMNIQDFKLDATTATSGADNLQILDEGGATSAFYTYLTKEDSELDKDGWVNEEFELADVTVPAGASVLIATEGETQVSVAGLVNKDAVTVKSVAGFNFVGNVSPMSIDIQDIKLGATATSGSDNLQILDEGGATSVFYTYLTKEDSELDKDGWVDEEFQLASMEITPGMGVLVATESSDVEITLPGTTL